MVAGPGVRSEGSVGNSVVPVPSSEVLGRVPVGLRVAAAIGWRLVVVLVAMGALGWIVGKVQIIVFPIALAILLSALLEPAVRLLPRPRSIPRALAPAVVVVGGL